MPTTAPRRPRGALWLLWRPLHLPRPQAQAQRHRSARYLPVLDLGPPRVTAASIVSGRSTLPWAFPATTVSTACFPSSYSLALSSCLARRPPPSPCRSHRSPRSSSRRCADAAPTAAPPFPGRGLAAPCTSPHMRVRARPHLARVCLPVASSVRCSTAMLAPPALPRCCPALLVPSASAAASHCSLLCRAPAAPCRVSCGRACVRPRPQRPTAPPLPMVAACCLASSPLQPTSDHPETTV